jgi:hypothetical protein
MSKEAANPYGMSSRAAKWTEQTAVVAPTAPKDAPVALSIRFERADYDYINQVVLPSMHGSKLTKENRPRKINISDYIRDLVQADIARRKQG